jgi:hypothetical protein
MPKEISDLTLNEEKSIDPMLNSNFIKGEDDYLFD